MPTTNYWDSVDPLALLNVSPQYRLPTQAILGNVQARTNYFLQGAQRIKNTIDDTEKFGLTLGNDFNKQAFQTQKQQADKSLKDVASSDLSIGDNQSKAQNLYKPLVTNQDFLLDSHLMDTYNKTYTAAQNDSHRKNSTNGYNTTLVAYNKEMQDMWRTANPQDARRFMQDKFAGAYWETPDKTQADLLKNVEKQFATTVEMDTPGSSKYSILRSKSVKIDKNDVKGYLTENLPETIKQQQEVEARLTMLELSKTLPPEQVMSHYKREASSIFGNKTAENNFRINSMKERLLTSNLTDAEKKTYNSDIQRLTNSNKEVKAQFDSIDFTAFVDKNKMQLGFDYATGLHKERSLDNLSSSIARTVLDSQTQRFDQGAFQQDKLAYQLAAAATKAKATNVVERTTSDVFSSPLLPDNRTIDQKKEDYVANIAETLSSPILKATTDLISNFGYKVSEFGKQTPLLEYIKTHPTETIDSLKSKMDEDSYKELSHYITYAYKDPGELSGTTEEHVEKNTKAFRLKDVQPRLQAFASDQSRFKELAGKFSKNYDQELSMVFDYNQSVKKTKENINNYSNIVKDELVKAGIDKSVVDGLTSEEMLDVNKLLNSPKVTGTNPIESLLKIGQKPDIYGKVYPVQRVTAYTLKNLYEKDPTTFKTIINNSTLPASVKQKVLNAKSFDDYNILMSPNVLNGNEIAPKIKEAINARIPVELATTTNSRVMTIDPTGKIDDINRQLTPNEVYKYVDLALSPDQTGNNASPEQFTALKDFIKSTDLKNITNVQFYQGEGNQSYFTVSLNKSDPNVKKALDDYNKLFNHVGSRIQESSDKIRFNIPSKALEEAKIFENRGDDKDVIDIRQNGSKSYDIGDDNELSVSATNGLKSKKDVYYISARPDGKGGVAAFNVSRININANDQPSLNAIGKLYNVPDINNVLTSAPSRFIKETVFKANDMGSKLVNYLQQEGINPAQFLTPNNEVDLNLMRSGLSKQLPSSKVSEIINKITSIINPYTKNNNINLQSTAVWHN